MLPARRPTAILFDMDGLMLDSERVYREAWFAAGEEYRIVMDDPTFQRFLGRTSADALVLLREIYGAEFAAVEFMARGGELADTRFAPHGMPHKPGLDTLLDFLEAHQIPRGIATSTRRKGALQSLGGLEHRFHALTTGDEVERGKPAPDIYLLAASRLGVAPADCLVLEDSAAGVRAGHAAGMQVIMVPDLVPASEETRALATAVLDSLTEVQRWLEAARRGSRDVRASGGWQE